MKTRWMVTVLNVMTGKTVTCETLNEYETIEEVAAQYGPALQAPHLEFVTAVRVGAPT